MRRYKKSIHMKYPELERWYDKLVPDKQLSITNLLELKIYFKACLKEARKGYVELSKVEEILDYYDHVTYMDGIGEIHTIGICKLVEEIKALEKQDE